MYNVHIYEFCANDGYILLYIHRQQGLSLKTVAFCLAASGSPTHARPKDLNFGIGTENVARNSKHKK